MDQKQFDAVLSDAEKRLRRLKVLYEQWFVGIERVEPAMPRKELEDMLTRLRREQLSNTAQRFRMQQLVQRHVALSTYWRRIGRQIEEGTYTRDLKRAKRRQQKHSEKEANGAELEGAYDVDVDVDLTDVLAEAERAADAAVSDDASAPQPLAAEGHLPPAAAPKNGRVPGRIAALEASQVATGQAERAVPGPPAPQPIAAGAFQATPPRPKDLAADPAVPSSKATAAEPAAQKNGAHAQPVPGAAIPPKPARPLMPPPAAAGKLAAPKPLGGIAPPPPPAAAGDRKPAPPAPAADHTSAGTLRAARTALRGAPPEAAGNEARRPSTEPRAISPFALPAAGSVRPQPLTPPKAPPPPPVVPAGAASQNGSSSAAGHGGPQPRRTEAMPRSPASAARPPQPSAAAKPANTNGPGASLDVERIYAQYVAARERNQERTDNVKRDTIEKTIRGMLPNLEKKHAGKKIDFEVVVKDGKVALKPIAK